MMGRHDPRLTGEHIRRVNSDRGSITLVGVVHDHPASIFRAREIVGTVQPDVLAVELPPLAISLFEAYARDDRMPPAFGGEMSAAIQAADTRDVRGIDGPSIRFLELLVGTLHRERPRLRTVVGVGEGLIAATRRAVMSKFAGALARLVAVRFEVDSPRSYATDWWDEPDRQAEDERVELGRAQAISGSLIPPTETRLRDRVREEHMTRQLEEASTRGDVVAIVGRDHLEPIADRLAET